MDSGWSPMSATFVATMTIPLHCYSACWDYDYTTQIPTNTSKVTLRHVPFSFRVSLDAICAGYQYLASMDFLDTFATLKK